MKVLYQGLQQLLTQHGIPWEETWGKQKGSKTVSDLHDEMLQGETFLRSRFDEKLRRKILERENQTALLRIYRNEPREIFLEYKQDATGVWLPRVPRGVCLASIAEKMRWNRPEPETFIEACCRGLKEELSCTVAPRVLEKGLVPGEPPPAPEFGLSSRFPGVYTKNTFFFATWVMPKRCERPYYIERKKGRVTSIFIGWDMKSPATYKKVEDVVPSQFLLAA